MYKVTLCFNGKPENTFEFKTEKEAMDFYNLKLWAVKCGLIGWSVSYPSRVK